MAGVIKNDGARTKRGPSTSQSQGAESQAKRIIQSAKETASAILAEARSEVEEASRANIELGMQEGIAQAEHMRQEIQGLSQRMWNEIEGEIVRAGMKIAREILLAEIAEREDAIMNVVTSALGAAQDAREVFLRIHPDHVHALRDNKQRLVDALALARQVDVREDRKVSQGGVLIQTESGVIDAQLETQISELERLLSGHGVN
jgi:type III secretion protein L